MCFLIRREQPSTVTKPIGSVWKICVILGVTEFCFWVGLKKDKYSFETISFSLASQEKMNAKEVVCINWKKEMGTISLLLPGSLKLNEPLILTSLSDQDRIFPHSINTISSREVTRITIGPQWNCNHLFFSVYSYHLSGVHFLLTCKIEWYCFKWVLILFQTYSKIKFCYAKNSADFWHALKRFGHGRRDY